MDSKKLLDCQIKAQKKWIENNRDQSNYIKSKSACKSFIKNKATKEDIDSIIHLAKEILKEKYFE
jgi:hypothetical protein